MQFNLEMCDNLYKIIDFSLFVKNFVLYILHNNDIIVNNELITYFLFNYKRIDL